MNTMYFALTAAFACVFALAYFVLGRVFRCPHKWELVDKTELPSRLDNLVKNGFTPVREVPASTMLAMAKVNATVVVRCDRCGKAKIIRMSNE